MAERRVSNYYYPPDFDPRRGSLNAQHGRKPSSTIRFAMPFSCWCTRCQALLAAGRRFNAEKRDGGKWMNIQIWEFVFRCPCGNTLSIKTDPEKLRYRTVQGLQIKAGQEEEKPPTEQLQTENDSMGKLERDKRVHGGVSEREANAAEIAAIYRAKERVSDEFDLSMQIRAKLRKERKNSEFRRQEARNLNLSLVRPASPSEELELAELEQADEKEAAVAKAVQREINSDRKVMAAAIGQSIGKSELGELVEKAVSRGIDLGESDPLAAAAIIEQQTAKLKRERERDRAQRSQREKKAKREAEKDIVVLDSDVEEIDIQANRKQNKVNNALANTNKAAPDKSSKNGDSSRMRLRSSDSVLNLVSDEESDSSVQLDERR